ncbi:BtrH N-terminal domain-containing protein [Halococcus sp. AFM35]|uniref:BtrH N-terminal domain-containing protein n=1 Tax=Halococcus sp. AFM35 TaxID=3421653 RepID=UPI003EB783B0
MHTAGRTCGSVSLRNLSAYRGCDFDEPLCFGLGAGIGFSYYETSPASRSTIMSRTSWLESTLFRSISHSLKTVVGTERRRGRPSGRGSWTTLQ